MSSTYSRYYVWVEGDDDERFVKACAEPELRTLREDVRIIKYSNMPNRRRLQYLKSIKGIQGADFVVLGDVNNAECVVQRRDGLSKEFKIPPDKVVVVVKEIESWYLAGLDASACKALKIKRIGRTDHLTKETFNKVISDGRLSRLDFMVECMNKFNPSVAATNNQSFRYFAAKLNLLK